jgi:hypothetical protein
MSAATTSASSPSTQAILKEQQAQFNANFILQTQQSMVDNQNQTVTAISDSHAQAASAATAGAREVGESNAHIVA